MSTKRNEGKENRDERKLYDIVCGKCGSEDRIPIEPEEGRYAFCRDCYFELKRKREKRYRQKSPRRKHGTRVSFQITCSDCGKDETLDYVPKGVSMDEVLCTECLEDDVEEEARWRTVKEEKDEEQRREWKIICGECGREDWLNFEPKPDHEYACTFCFYEHEQPQKERLENKREVGRSVYIRKSDD